MTTTSFMEFISAQDKRLLFVDKCANHMHDILFLRNTKFLYYPPDKHAWCVLCVFRKMSLPHVAFPAMMSGMMTMQVAATLGGRKRDISMTMNWFCQAHAAYKLVRSYFYLQSIVRCHEQNIWTWNS